MNLALLAFGCVLLAASLFSARAERSALSNATLFLAAGIAGVATGVLPQGERSESLRTVANLALVAILFTDGMRVPLGELRQCWRLPGRALLLGMPLTFAMLALAAHVLLSHGWLESCLIAAVLAPTDPVFASAIVGRRSVPKRLRRLLNLESGLNDGLALPVVLATLAALGDSEKGWSALAGEVVGGVLLGLLLPLAAGFLRRQAARHLPAPFCTLYVASVGLLVFATARMLGLNEYLASFAAGMTLASTAPADIRQFHQSGVAVGEVLKYLAIMSFGAFMGWRGLAAIRPAQVAFAASALLIARPGAILAVLAGSALPWRQRAVAAWFGPKGFSSVVYAVIVLQSPLANAAALFHACAVVVLLSMVVHSSTDVPVVHWLDAHAGTSDASDAPPA